MLPFDTITTITPTTSFGKSANNEDNDLTYIACSKDRSQIPLQKSPTLITSQKTLVFNLLTFQSLLNSLSSFTSINSINTFTFIKLNHWILFLSILVTISFLLTYRLHTSLKKDSYSKNTLIILFSLSNSYWIAYIAGIINSFIIPMVFFSIGIFSWMTGMYMRLLKEKAISLVLWVIFQGSVNMIVMTAMLYLGRISNVEENERIWVIVGIMIMQLPLTWWYYRRIVLSENVVKGMLMENMLKVYLLKI